MVCSRVKFTFLNLYMEVVSLGLRPLYPTTTTTTTRARWTTEPVRMLQNNLLPLSGIEPGFLSQSARSLVTVQTTPQQERRYACETLTGSKVRKSVLFPQKIRPHFNPLAVIISLQNVGNLHLDKACYRECRLKRTKKDKRKEACNMHWGMEVT